MIELKVQSMEEIAMECWAIVDCQFKLARLTAQMVEDGF